MTLPWTFDALRGPRLRIDRLRDDDLDALTRIQSDPEVCRWMLYEPRTREQVRALIEAMAPLRTLAADGDDLQPAIRLADGTLIGTLYVKLASAADRQAEIGWALSPAAQGHGYAAEAATVMLDALFDAAGMHRVRAELDPRNVASVALCRRLGMREEALFREDLWFKGAWGDTGVHAILDREWRARRGDIAARPAGVA
jgi:RimJ/RimL family protein N-acetyltransferase